ncbi:RNA polymerase sigma factor [Formosimonas limnophila]|uniref:RNA polymerase sigma factor n=1 Tax=Formosimonas limnophila TaxID=1384487 RepID=A0A8J3CNA2_9BURK|nr:sigma-70 family RNA polymerase sigma factor [Formosimonas limnophila]GHA73519.1 RNA polymerase sigma factor [Formosimonas limnophila]
MQTHNDIWQELATHHGYLLKVARRLTPNDALAQDVVQDTLLAACEKFNQFQGKSSLRTWLTTILKNRLRDTWRADKRWVAPLTQGEDGVEDFDALFRGDGHWEKETFVQWLSPEQLVSEQQFIAVLDDCMKKLPAKTGQVFMMSQVLEMSTDEIRVELGITASHLWVLLYRARMTLKLCLEKNWLGLASA